MRHPLRSSTLPAVLALACAFGPASAAAAPRLPLQFIDVLGRVTGPGGSGVEGVRVVLDGARDVSTTTDATGSYTLTVPMSALGDPARRMVTARITAQRPGWAFALRNGQGALALELRMESRAQPARCRVRSNVLQTMDAVVAAIRRGDRNAVIANADFVGGQGRRPARRVALRSEAVTVVGEPTEPAIVADARAAAGPPQADRPVRAARDTVARQTEAGPQAQVAREPGRDQAPPALRAAQPDGRGDAAQRAAKDSVASTPKRGSPATPAAVTPAPGAAATPTRARTEPPRVEPPRAGAAAPRERPSARPRIRRIEAQGGSRDSGAAEADQVPGSVKLPGPGVTQTDASLIRRIEPNAGAADLPGSTRDPGEALAGDDGCACRIRGTVEIHPDHLLTKRLNLIVTLREAPAVRDTIQLFMGSPRPFELPAVRCGTWHIEVDAVARRHFSVVSADGRGPIDCRKGGLRQLRVVLAPN
jgi:hypothetical protein